MPLHARLRASVRGVAAVGVGAVLCALAAPAAAAAATAPRTPVSSAAHHVAGDYVLGPSTAPAASGVLAPAKLRAAVVPASVDLRANAPAVGDQGQLSDCAAWTIGYAIMGYYANAKAGQGAPYAPLYLYQQSLRAPSTAPNGGTSGYAVLTEAQTNGVDTQADYTQGLYDWHTLPTAAQKANAAAYKVTGWAHLFQGGNQGAKAQQLIQQALAAGTPVALGLEVFDNFGTLGPNQVYSATTGRDLGGHMVTAFGYTAAGVIVRNSWGIDWGTNGDAILSWSYVAKYGIDAYSVSGISTPALTQA
ncbi:MAG: hypothetical protein QOJ62_1153, partial [Actinomycetota bacterium]|nr:hypothetical protein [Actinomycetota bacterium]